jgi:hypothetical protein
VQAECDEGPRRRSHSSKRPMRLADGHVRQGSDRHAHESIMEKHIRETWSSSSPSWHETEDRQACRIRTSASLRRFTRRRPLQPTTKPGQHGCGFSIRGSPTAAMRSGRERRPRRPTAAYTESWALRGARDSELRQRTERSAACLREGRHSASRSRLAVAGEAIRPDGTAISSRSAERTVESATL